MDHTPDSYGWLDPVDLAVQPRHDGLESIIGVERAVLQTKLTIGCTCTAVLLLHSSMTTESVARARQCHGLFLRNVLLHPCLQQCTQAAHTQV